MEKFCNIDVDSDSPIIAAAIHHGHRLSTNLEKLSALSSQDRLREEDPHTGEWTEIAENRIVANYSRFEVDLNRPREKCIYLVPEDAWGLTVWHNRPGPELLAASYSKYDGFYRQLDKALKGLFERYEQIVVLDLHSYNHQRLGPDMPFDDAELNPDINIGTGTMDREYWSRIVDRFIHDLSQYKYFNKSLDVRENIKFRGGYFSRWIHENYSQRACCLSVEFKKFFMNEWTGEPRKEQLTEIKKLLRYTLKGILEEIDR